MEAAAGIGGGARFHSGGHTSPELAMTGPALTFRWLWIAKYGASRLFAMVCYVAWVEVGGRAGKQSYAERGRIDGRCDGLPWEGL